MGGAGTWPLPSCGAVTRHFVNGSREGRHRRGGLGVRVTHRVTRGPATGRPARTPGRGGAGPDGVAAGARAGRIAVPACAVHARAGGRALPSDTDAWSSPVDSGSCGLVLQGRTGRRQPVRIRAPGTVTTRPGICRRDLRPRASALAPGDIWIPRVGRKDLTPEVLAPGPRPLDTDLLHCHLLGPVATSSPVIRSLTVVGTGSSRDGMSRRRRWASPEGAHVGGIFGAPPAGTTVPPSAPGARRCRRRAG